MRVVDLLEMQRFGERRRLFGWDAEWLINREIIVCGAELEQLVTVLA